MADYVFATILDIFNSAVQIHTNYNTTLSNSIYLCILYINVYVCVYIYIYISHITVRVCLLEPSSRSWIRLKFVSLSNLELVVASQGNTGGGFHWVFYT